MHGAHSTPGRIARQGLCGDRRANRVPSSNLTRSSTMQWNDPAFCDIRLGFEVTAYVYVR